MSVLQRRSGNAAGAATVWNRVVTLATRDFVPHAERLARSLLRVQPDSRLTVYSDEPAAFRHLESASLEARLLTSIGELGPSRARFRLYSEAAQSGPFLYLDADVIVLAPLAPDTEIPGLGACPDDLRACPFVADTSHPWPGDPALESTRYVNAGVVFAGPGASAFFDEAWTRCQVDELWERYTTPELLDNHFLCAMLELLGVGVTFLDPYEFNWPGFIFGSELRASREGDALVPRGRRKPLRLAHFAGIHDVEAFLERLPIDVASLLDAVSAPPGDPSPSEALRAFRASLGGRLGAPDLDPTRVEALDVLLKEVSSTIRVGLRLDGATPPALIDDPDGLASVALSVPAARVRWNGLSCGGSYLEGAEYNYVWELSDRLGTRSVLELGAGETTILFHRRGLTQLALEPQDGPWLDRARGEGCRCALVPFVADTGRLDEVLLREAIAEAAAPIDLLFVDSQAGAATRRSALGQMLELVRPRYVLFHDARRDATSVFDLAAQGGLSILEHLPTVRGMVLLGAEGGLPATPPADPRLDAPLVGARAPIGAEPPAGALAAGAAATIGVRLRNESDSALSSAGSHPVRVSYHWLTPRGEPVVFDGERTELPFTVLPGHEVGMRVLVRAPREPGNYVLQLSAVQEGVAWFHELDADSSFTCRVAVSCHDDARARDRQRTA